MLRFLIEEGVPIFAGIISCVLSFIVVIGDLKRYRKLKRNRELVKSWDLKMKEKLVKRAFFREEENAKDNNKDTTPGVTFTKTTMINNAEYFLNLLNDTNYACRVKRAERALLRVRKVNIKDNNKNTNPNITFTKTTMINDNIPFLLSTSTDQKIMISSQQFTIGRDNSCNLEMNDSFVSKKHLILKKEDETWYIIDFNSLNGTYLNNKKLRPNSKTILNSGDCIKIGRSAFCFYLGRV
ncbi:MAG: FHA domain-containing protein [Turicibacter sp.]|nr:FHA domain-containing protein [Turicibacter sp.]